MQNENRNMSTRYLAVVAMLTALAFIAKLISNVIPSVNGFLSYDPKDAVIVIAGFIFGPMTSVLMTVVVSLIEMFTISSTGIYGLLMNIVSTCAFAVPAAFFYQKHRTQRGAIGGLCLSVMIMAVVMVAWNYIITPFYMGVPRETVAGMLATVFLPFNLVKGGINAGLTMLLYKPLVMALRSAGLVAYRAEGAQKGKISFGFLLFSLAVLVTFVLLFLVMAGVL